MAGRCDECIWPVIYCVGMTLVMGLLAWGSHLDHRRKIRRQTLAKR